MDPTITYVIELSSEDYNVETGDGDLLVFNLTPRIASELTPGTYSLSSSAEQTISNGHLFTTDWEYSLTQGTLTVERTEDQYLLSWEFMAHREGYRIEVTRNAYIKGSYEGDLPMVEITVW